MPTYDILPGLLGFVTRQKWAVRRRNCTGRTRLYRMLRRSLLAFLVSLLRCHIVVYMTHVKVEFLGMAGAFGVILSGVQTAALEWNELAEVVWTDQVVLFVIGYSTR